jgi:hypothetical protein
MHKATISSPVTSLFKPTGPSAVEGLLALFALTTLAACITAVVVDPVDAVVFRRQRTHVVQECLARLQPSFANIDPSPAIVVVCGTFRIGTTGNHTGPRMILNGVRLSVLSVDQSSALSLITAATGRHSIAESSSRYHLLDSAITAATPTSFLIDRRHALKDREATKSLPDKIHATKTGGASDRSAAAEAIAAYRLDRAAIAATEPVNKMVAGFAGLITLDDDQLAEPLPREVDELSGIGRMPSSHDVSFRAKGCPWSGRDGSDNYPLARCILSPHFGHSSSVVL